MIKLKWILNFAPLITSVLMIRQYLGYFDQASLFTESVSLPNIFSLVFIYAVLATLAMLTIFYMPSIVLYSIIPKASGVIYYTKLKLKIALLLFCLMITAALLIFTWVFFIEGISFWINTIVSAVLIGLFLLAYFVLSRWIFRFNLNSILKYQKTNAPSTIKTIKIGALYTVLIGVLNFSYPVFMMLKWINPEYEIENLRNFLCLFGMTVILGVNAITPGVIYIIIRPPQGLLYLTKNVMVFITFVLIMLAITLTPFFPQVINKTMIMSGISDWKTRDFIIDEKVIPSSHFKHEEWNTKIIIPEKIYSISGLLVYSLNDVKLICPESVKEHYDNMLKFMPFNYEYDRKMSQQLLDAGAYCQPFPRGGITRLSK